MFKRLFCIVIAVLFIFNCYFASAEPLSVSAKSAVLLNAETLSVYYDKNMNEKLSMASTTKIMTAVILCENKRLDEEITVTYEMIAVEGTSMGLREDDKVSYYALLCGLLLSSGNDAANAIALSICDNFKDFASMMNKKAKEIGMKNTNFVTPSGLDSEKHYSSAYDMALLASYALKIEAIKSIVCQKSIVVEYGSPKVEHTLHNHNRLLSLYKNAIGFKTGFTKKSGRCLVSAAQKDGEVLIAVTLNAPDDWDDHILLYEYGFQKFKDYCVSDTVDLNKISVADVSLNKGDILIEKKTVSITDSDKGKITYKTYIPPFTYASQNGKKIGEIEYFCNGKYLTTSNVFLNIDTKNEKSKRDYLFEFFYNIKKLLSI